MLNAKWLVLAELAVSMDWTRKDIKLDNGEVVEQLTNEDGTYSLVHLQVTSEGVGFCCNVHCGGVRAKVIPFEHAEMFINGMPFNEKGEPVEQYVDDGPSYPAGASSASASSAEASRGNVEPPKPVAGWATPVSTYSSRAS